MKVRAKFYVNQITHYMNGGSVTLQAVTGTSEENKTFWKYTPSGKIEMEIDNEVALNGFEVGKEYYIDFVPVEEKQNETL